jgi:hypothetical protein
MAGVFLDHVRVHPAQCQRSAAVVQDQVIKAVPGGGVSGLGAGSVEVVGDRRDAVVCGQQETVVDVLGMPSSSRLWPSSEAPNQTRSIQAGDHAFTAVPAMATDTVWPALPGGCASRL